MDHFGPIPISANRKHYGLIFMCLMTRAIHLEPCESLDVKSFLLALERFIQRRSRPRTIQADNGSAFKAAAPQLAVELLPVTFQTDLANQAASALNIKVQFNPPRTPHWGGSWECLIQEVKKILTNATLTHHQLSSEVFHTVLTRAEGILNRRPIAFLDDGIPLRPAMLIAPTSSQSHGFPLHASTKQINEVIRQAEKVFWENFSAIYLQLISAERVFGGKAYVHLEAGDRVLVNEPTKFGNQWTSATVHEAYPSPGGFVRSVLVQYTPDKPQVRIPINKIGLAEGPTFKWYQATRGKPLPPPFPLLPGPTLPASAPVDDTPVTTSMQLPQPSSPLPTDDQPIAAQTRNRTCMAPPSGSHV